jgi:CelD/BcsL family acetyltransferase involved in cellulose biosynthesis
MVVEARRATAGDRSHWDDHVASCGDSSLAHTEGWLAAIQCAYGGELELLVAHQGEKVVGLLPLFIQKKMMLRLMLSPPPKTLIEYLGPLVLHSPTAHSREKERLTNEVLQSFLDYAAAEYRSDIFNMRATLPFGGSRIFSWNGYDVTPRFTYVVDLRQTPDDLIAGFRKDARQSIRKAERTAVQFRASGELADALAIYQAACARYREQGMGAPYSEAYLRELWSRLAPDRLCALLLERDGTIQMGGIVSTYNCTLSGLSGATRASLDGVSLNDYFHLCIMRWAAEQGLMLYDMVGANTRSIAEYKAKFGGELKEYYKVERTNLLGRLAIRAYVRFGR